MEANSSELDQELLLLAKCRYSNNYMNDGQIWVKICETSEVNHDTVLLFSDFQEPLQGGWGALPGSLCSAEAGRRDPLSDMQAQVIRTCFNGFRI